MQRKIGILIFLFGMMIVSVNCGAQTKTLQEIHASAYDTEVVFMVPRATMVKYKVKSGDTLLGLSHRFYTTVPQIKSLNGLKSHIIVIGRTLKMPTYKMEPIKLSLGRLLTDTETYSDTEFTDSRAFELIKLAEEYQGIPYKWGGESPYRVDCSGFVALLYKCFNIQLPHSSREQYKLGEEVQNLVMGDLLFFATKRKARINHVGIYLGNGKFIHASSREKKVAISSLEAPFYRERFVTAKRILSVTGQETVSLEQ